MRRIDPYFPLSYGVPRVDDRRIISGIIFVIRIGLPGRDATAAYGPPETIYPCAGVRDRMEALNSATCDNHHGDDADVMPKKGVVPDALKVIVTDALELIGTHNPAGSAADVSLSGADAARPSPAISVL